MVGRMKNGTRLKSLFPFSHFAPTLTLWHEQIMFVFPVKNHGNVCYAASPKWSMSQQCLKHFVPSLSAKCSLPLQIPPIKDTSSIAMSPVYEEPLTPSKVIYINQRVLVSIKELFSIESLTPHKLKDGLTFSAATSVEG